MSDWLNVWMIEWLTDWMNEWLTDWLNEWRDEWMNEWKIYTFYILSHKINKWMRKLYTTVHHMFFYYFHIYIGCWSGCDQWLSRYPHRWNEINSSWIQIFWRIQPTSTRNRNKVDKSKWYFHKLIYRLTCVFLWNSALSFFCYMTKTV